MWPTPQETADLVTFTEEEILNGKHHFLCSVNVVNVSIRFVTAWRFWLTEEVTENVIEMLKNYMVPIRNPTKNKKKMSWINEE